MGGPLDPQPLFLALCPGLNPACPLRVCPAKARVEGSGGGGWPGLVEREGLIGGRAVDWG